MPRGGSRPGKPKGRSPEMIGILIAVLVAALVWAVCVALGLPAIVGIVAAILVLLAGIPSGGCGLGRRSAGAGSCYWPHSQSEVAVAARNPAPRGPGSRSGSGPAGRGLRE